MSDIVKALVGHGAAIADEATLADMNLSPGTAIVDDFGQVWQLGPPEFHIHFWFAANGYTSSSWKPGGFGGPDFPVRVIHVGDVDE